MSKCILNFLGYSTEGYLISNLLRNRGRSRKLISWILTKFMQNQLENAYHGILKLPTAGIEGLPPVCLTSWLPRFNSLPLVLLNLLEQEQLPPKIFVWLSYEDYKLLNPQLIELFEKSIVEFHQVQDFGPHKKWLPMILESAEPFVICDDDIFYPKSWYKSLITSDDGKSYVAHRCHLINVSSQGEILPYASWNKDIQDFGQASHLFFPVGCGGNLINPEYIADDFKNWQLISRLCPKADDIWLKLAHVQSGIPCKKSLYMFPCIEYLETQTVSLMHNNVDQAYNDIQIQQCLAEFKLDLTQFFKG